MPAKKETAKKPGTLVTFLLHPKGQVPALVVSKEKPGLCLTVFAEEGPYVAHNVKQGSKPGSWK